MGISGRADMPWLGRIAEDVRARAAALDPGDWSDTACRIRQEVLDVDAWERRRRGRPIRLWSAQLLVRTAALDVDDARFRLERLAHPYHRTGAAPRLYSIAGPMARTRNAGVTTGFGDARAIVDTDGSGKVEATDDEPGPERAPRENAALLRMYPAGALLAHDAAGGRRTTARRIQAADHAAALEVAGRGRLRGDQPGDVEPGEPTPTSRLLRCWQAWQRVLFLAGPGDAPARAEELAATVVDARGASAAELVRVELEDGRRDPVDGRIVHPAYDLGPFGIDAAWDDHDADAREPGDASARAAVLLRAADEVRVAFGIGTGGEDRTRRDAAGHGITPRGGTTPDARAETRGDDDARVRRPPAACPASRRTAHRSVCDGTGEDRTG